ncbi:MAG: alpha/beta hydrolase-fold protein [Aestuariibacter sp.]
MKIPAILLSFALSVNMVFASPTNVQPNQLGQLLTFAIDETDRTMEVSFWKPDTDGQYPLLVVLDGQRYFAYATSMHDMMQDYGWTPPFAVLGINIDPQERWQLYTQHRKAVLNTLSSMVFPYLEKHFGVSQERLLFGWEAAGGFALRTLKDHPSLFNSYIAASPSPLYGKYFPNLKQDHLEMTAAMASEETTGHLYFAQGSYDYPQYLGLEALQKSLSSNAASGLRWKYDTIADASHSSLGFEALMRGVRDYYYYYDIPNFSNFADFEMQGGFAYLDNYFQTQSRIYGFDQQRLDKNRFRTLRKLSFNLLVDANVNAFKQFLKQLQDTDFLDRSHMNHIYQYGILLLEAGDNSDAMHLFNYLIERHPTEARPIYGKGLTVHAMNQPEHAQNLFQQALKLAQENQDFRLTEYQQTISTLSR